jgi:hypothetical protein
VAEPHHDTGDRVAFLVRVLENARCDDSTSIDEERPGERNPVLVAIGRRYGRVEDSVLANDTRADIRQQRKRYAASRCKIRQDRHRVIADCRQPEAGFANFLRTALQLHELRFAIESPIGGPEEDEYCALRSHHGLKRLQPAGLILQRE